LESPSCKKKKICSQKKKKEISLGKGSVVRNGKESKKFPKEKSGGKKVEESPETPSIEKKGELTILIRKEEKPTEKKKKLKGNRFDWTKPAAPGGRAVGKRRGFYRGGA